MLRLRRPDAGFLSRVVAEQREVAPDYPGVGGTLRGETPAGFRADRHRVDLGDGDEVFDRAVRGLRDWAPHRSAGLVVETDGPISEGTTVVMAAPLPVGFAVAACRIVAVIDEQDAFGFAYGTLPLHPAKGEELFVVRRTAGAVSFEVVVFSRPRQVLAKLGGPVARRMQTRVTQQYVAGMVAAASTPSG